MPAPTNVHDYSELASHYWNVAVKKYLSQFNVSEIYIVIDKPASLPPPRTIVHANRETTSKHAIVPLSTINISNSTEVFRGCQYTSMLHNKAFKSSLITYLCKKICGIFM